MSSRSWFFLLGFFFPTLPHPFFSAEAQVVCINPPFTEAYLADVMSRLPELKLRFRLRTWELGLRLMRSVVLIHQLVLNWSMLHP